MTVRPGITYPPQEITILMNSGGLGDAVCRLPALVFLEKNYPHCTPHVYVVERLHEVFKAVLTRAVVHVFPPKEAAPERPGYYFGAKNTFHTTLGTHLVDHGFNVLLDRDDVPMQDKSYPRLPDLSVTRAAFPLPPRYVVLTPGYTSAVRLMLPDVVNGIAKGCLERGYTPVYLGSKTEHIDTSAQFEDGVDYSLGLDLRNKTSMLEAAAVMQGARAVFALDNGLAHLAGMTAVPIIVGYSTQLPELRLPIRDGVLGKDCYVVQPKTCYGCEPFIRYVYSHDFRTCFVGDKLCIKEMPAQAYLAHLDTLLTSA
jgi:ADP-heptose:LPS heptosyltransferase